VRGGGQRRDLAAGPEEIARSDAQGEGPEHREHTIEDPPFDGRKPADTGFPYRVKRLPIRGIESAGRPLRVGRPGFRAPSGAIHKRLRRFP
jgi:hypothetical protein